jgi:predicted P-loop ATPase
MAQVAQALEGYAYACHSTHSPECYRLVMPLSRPVLPAEWPGFHERAISALGLPADPSCKDLARLYFFPSCPEGTEPLACVGEGRPLDVDETLEAPAHPTETPDPKPPSTFEPAKTPDEKPPSTFEFSEKPPAPSSDVVDLTALKGALRKSRGRNKHLIDAVLERKPLAAPGERDTNVHKAASSLASISPGPPSAETLLELMTHSIRAMECQPEGVDYWLEKARFSLVRGLERRKERDDKAARERAILLQLSGASDAPALDVAPGASDWRRLLITTKDELGEPRGFKSCEANLELVLENDPQWKGKIRFNVITKAIEVLGGPLAGRSVATLDTETNLWLQQSDYRIFVRSHTAGEALLAVARRHEYDPLAQWLNHLNWDGTPRISRLFEWYLNATGNLAHLRQISAKWLISLVARALEPGCKVDTVLILEGKYGVGKSRALKVLGGEWFCDTPLHIGDKDSRMLASAVWIAELAELASFRRADSETMKNFFSQSTDHIRLPYGKVTEKFPRRCVFVGTTNKDEYLVEPNRREWPVRCGAINLDELEKDRAQLLAEAVVQWRKGEPWWLDDAADLVAREEARQRGVRSGRSEVILEWWLRMPEDKRPEELSTQDIARDALGLLSGQITDRVLQEIGHAAKEIGFSKIRRRRGGVLVWVYVAPEELRTAPHSAPGTRTPPPLELVVNPK